MPALVTKRLVLLGHPLVGKCTTAQTIGRKKNAEFNLITAQQAEPIVDRGLQVSWEEDGIQYEVATLVGAVWDPLSWRTTASAGTEFILLIDIQAAAGGRSVVELIKILQLGLGPVAAVQITKADLTDHGPVIDLDDVTIGCKTVGLPCFISRHDQPLTLVAACCHVLGCSLPTEEAQGGRNGSNSNKKSSAFRFGSRR